MQKVLIIAPHPDDEVLGCGGTITKHVKAGDMVYVCIVTKAYTPEWSDDFIKNRSKEIEKAHKILDIHKTICLDLPTVKLDTFPQVDLNAAIFNVVVNSDPDIVYIPHKGDLNKDHRLVHYASLVATRPAGRNLKKVLSYEILSVTEWGSTIDAFIPNYYVDISETFDTKIKAMTEYSSELKPYPHPRSLEIIEALAKKRGSEILVPFAEAFVLIREIQ